MSTEPMKSVKDAEARFVAWATTQDDVRAAFVMGSQARVDHPADAWSDLDIVVFVTDVTHYQTTSDWIEQMAPVWIALSGRTVANDIERLVLFEGGYQVDFVLHDVATLLGTREMLAPENVPDTVRRGVRILVDKDNALPAAPAPMPLLPQTPPDQGAFNGRLDGFWFGANYAARQLARGDLFALQGALCGLRGQLLPFIEWHARTLHGWDHDTWHNAKFIAQWAEPWVIEALAATYVPLERQACWRGLLALLDLARRLAADVAAGLGLAYPEERVQAMAACIASLADHAAP